MRRPRRRSGSAVSSSNERRAPRVALKAPDPGRIARGVVWGAILLALGIWVYPHARQAVRYARLVGAEPPAALPVPVKGAEQSGLSDTWGAARSSGRTHQGIDIFASRRTPILSTTDGILARRGENGLGGRTVTVLGPGGWRHYYAHLQQYGGQSEGDWIRTGEVIGFVGTSGNAPAGAPHLHYGIYGGGGALNPYPLLVAADSASAAGR